MKRIYCARYSVGAYADTARALRTTAAAMDGRTREARQRRRLAAMLEYAAHLCLATSAARDRSRRRGRDGSRG